jgi:protein-disulfide isomerase
MLLARRTVLMAAGACALTSAAAPRARAASLGELMSERALGRADAKVTAQEWFSLTCSHCAFFSVKVMPEVRTKLIDTGILRIVYKDFPLDRVALSAAMVARALPPDQYVPFITMLLGSQDRWAFARGIDPVEELRKRALAAGMSEETFRATLGNQGLQAAILTEQDRAESQLKVNSTPTFIINGQRHPGAVEFDAFNRMVMAAVR